MYHAGAETESSILGELDRYGQHHETGQGASPQGGTRGSGSLSDDQEDFASTMMEARECAVRLGQSLPSSLSVAALGVKSKAPWQLLSTREALIWRTEELARNACDAMDRDDLAVAAILTRAVAESAALAWKLMEVLNTRHQQTPQQLNEILMRLLVGSRVWDDFPQAVQILTSIDRMDKRIPGVRRGYDNLSEIAHPNWRGVFGLYSRTDEAEFTTYFGRGIRGAEGNRASIANVLVGSLGLFEYAYNKISDGMPAFLAELEQIWPEDVTEKSSIVPEGFP